jgi:hypothetical protein
MKQDRQLRYDYDFVTAEYNEHMYIVKITKHQPNNHITCVTLQMARVRG